jgi:ABC-type multidrug transport system fused ATPase/permease subunit
LGKANPEHLAKEQTGGDGFAPQDVLRVKDLVVNYNVDAADGMPALQVSRLELLAGEVLGITGSVGSGKSTLLAALLDELPTSALGGNRKQLLAPGVRVIAVIGQVPMVLSGTVRENITFKEAEAAEGDEEEAKDRKYAYAQAIWACGLGTDLEQLPNRDLTVIGDRGHTLSGGQRQRVALARVAYRCGMMSARERRQQREDKVGSPKPPTLVVLDAPLSACDAEVSATVFGRLMGILASRADGRAVVMTTQSAQRLAQCDYSIELVKGVVSASQVKGKENAFVGMESFPADIGLQSSAAQTGLEMVSKHGDAKSGAKSVTQAENKPWNWLIDHLMRGAGGPWHIAFCCLCICGDGGFIELSVWTLNLWVEEEEKNGHSQSRSLYWALVYLGLVSLYFITAVMRHVTIINGSDTALARTHSGVVRSLLGAKFELLGRRDTAAAGPDKPKKEKKSEAKEQAMSLANMLTLLTERVAHIEGETLVPTELLMLNLFFCVVITVLSVAFVPLLAIPFFVGFSGFVLLFRSQSYRAVQAVALEETERRVPVFHRAQECLAGGTTIRAYGATDAFVEWCDEAVDAHSVTLLLARESNSWLSLRCAALGTMFYGAVVASSLARSLTGGQTGFLLVNAIFYAVIIRNAVEMHGTCVEVAASREALSLALTLPQEDGAGAKDLGDKSAKKDESESLLLAKHEGPEIVVDGKGAEGEQRLPPLSLTLDNVSLRYSPGAPLALNGVSFALEPGESLGVVGRTGAGKSSLVACITRLCSPCGGRVLIGGEDAATLPLDQLRGESLVVVTQEALLFRGSLRANLDPFSKYTSEELWAAVQAVGIEEVVGGKMEVLDTFEVQEGGGNLSVGEIALLCLARAALRRPRLVLLDEPTAALDDETERRVQAALKDVFGHGVTSMHVAHRLPAVAHCDRVLVMGEHLSSHAPNVWKSTSRHHLSSLTTQFVTLSCTYARRELS